MSEPQIVKSCPQCGADLVVRENHDDRSHFLGCSKWPACKHTEALTAYQEMRSAGADELPGFDA